MVSRSDGRSAQHFWFFDFFLVFFERSSLNFSLECPSVLIWGLRFCRLGVDETFSWFSEGEEVMRGKNSIFVFKIFHFFLGDKDVKKSRDFSLTPYMKNVMRG